MSFVVILNCMGSPWRASPETTFVPSASTCSGRSSKQRLHYEITLRCAGVRQREFFFIDHIHLIVNDIEVERAGAVGNLTHATKAVFDGMQILKELFRRNARGPEAPWR